MVVVRLPATVSVGSLGNRHEGEGARRSIQGSKGCGHPGAVTGGGRACDFVDDVADELEGIGVNDGDDLRGHLRGPKNDLADGGAAQAVPLARFFSDIDNGLAIPPHLTNFAAFEGWELTHAASPHEQCVRP